MVTTAHPVTVYGLKNCDSCRRARAWLAENDVAFRFHDVRDDGLDEARLETWCRASPWTRLLNTRSRTWRELDAREKTNLDAERAQSLLLQYPTLVKRPVLERGDELLIGFSPAAYAQALLE